ncbi:MAG: energy transducer TonB [Betaproteobacteria bacterium]|nr:energy transducer TonB [Betaproteobacteria bacterium]
MQSWLLISIGLHIFIVMGVGFQFIDANRFLPPHNVLDVVLVNAKGQNQPRKADALAQANLDGGGNTDEERRAKTPLPAIEESAAQNEVKAQQERITQLEQEIKTLMTQAKSSTKVLQGEAAQQPSGSPEPLSASDLLQKSIEISRLEAQIAREYEAYQQRPKRKFVGARTSEYRFAQYIDNWRQKVERVGNLNYPEEAKTKRVYARIQVTVAIKANGEVESVEVHSKKAPKVLRNAVVRIMSLSGPFERFPDNIKKDTDILHITRTWVFGKGDVLSSE